MNVSNFLKIVKTKKKLSPHIRLYLIQKDTHHFINDGILKKGFSSKLRITKNRDSILSAFSKMAFLFDEIIRIRIIGFSNKCDSSELLYLLNLVPVNRKIRTFLDWKVFGPKFTKDMSRLFEVRNDALHCISLNEISYNPKNKISLSSDSGFKKFEKDFQNAWKMLLKIYVKEQEKLDLKKLFEEL